MGRPFWKCHHWSPLPPNDPSAFFPCEPLESPAITPINTDRRTIPVVLTWDGMDQTAPAEAGIYQFELRAKLLSNGEKAADAHGLLAKTRDTGVK